MFSFSSLLKAQVTSNEEIDQKVGPRICQFHGYLSYLLALPVMSFRDKLAEWSDSKLVVCPCAMLICLFFFSLGYYNKKQTALMILDTASSLSSETLSSFFTSTSSKKGVHKF